MNNPIRRLGFLLISAICVFPVSAASYYVANCDSGAVAGCVSGADSNPGTSAAKPWKTTAKVQAMFGGLGAGDKILFARGGAWSGAGMSLRNTNSRIDMPITFDAYQPTWYSGTAKPRLTETNSEYGVFTFSGGPSSIPNEGYVVRNFYLSGGPGQGTGSTAFFAYNGANGLTVENVTMTGFGVGFYCGLGLKKSALRNSRILNSRSQGVLNSCSDTVIENNVFDNNGYDPHVRPGDENRLHSIYIDGDLVPASNIIIRNNKFSNTTKYNGQCKGVVIVAHGILKNLKILNNRMDESANTGTEKGGCYGISVTPGNGSVEYFDNVLVRGNRIINVGNVGIELASCRNCIVENNLIIKTDGQEAIGIQAPRDAQPTAPAKELGAITIRNNSIYFDKPAAWSVAIQLAKGNKHVMVNNLIYFGAGHAEHFCFTGNGTLPNLDLSLFIKFDNNLCYHESPGKYSQTHATLATAQAAGFDLHGKSVNPKLLAKPSASNDYAMTLASSSPAINTGNAPYGSLIDITGLQRGTQPDIGAFEKLETAR